MAGQIYFRRHFYLIVLFVEFSLRGHSPHERLVIRTQEWYVDQEVTHNSLSIYMEGIPLIGGVSQGEPSFVQFVVFLCIYCGEIYLVGSQEGTRQGKLLVHCETYCSLVNLLDVELFEEELNSLVEDGRKIVFDHSRTPTLAQNGDLHVGVRVIVFFVQEPQVHIERS